LRGQNVRNIRNIAQEYVRSDVRLYPYAVSVINVLHQKGLSVIVISGAPQEVLEVFGQDLGVDMVIGITVKTSMDGKIFSGFLKRNSAEAQTKNLQVRYLKRHYNILLALGDSDADIPMLKAAKLPIMLLNSDKPQYFSLPLGTMKILRQNLLVVLTSELDKLKREDI
jgi:HAD superfamily phosphoserine phosphatase-like hydrolase